VRGEKSEKCWILNFWAMDDNELIEEYLNGDEKAFEILYERYKSNVFSFIFSMVKNKEIANDIFQEVFVNVINNLKKYQKGNFKAWIFLIARNKVLDYIKSQKNRFEKEIISIDESFDEEDKLTYKDIIKSDIDPHKNLIKEMENENLYSAIEKLPPQYREIIFLKHFSGLKFVEISEILNTPINTLLSRFKRAIEMLQKIMKDEK